MVNQSLAAPTQFLIESPVQRDSICVQHRAYFLKIRMLTEYSTFIHSPLEGCIVSVCFFHGDSFFAKNNTYFVKSNRLE